MASALDRLRQGALVLGAGSSLAARLDAAAVGEEAPQKAEVLVVHEGLPVHAHGAGASTAAAVAPRPGVLTPRRVPLLPRRALLNGGSELADLRLRLVLFRLLLDLSLHTILTRTVSLQPRCVRAVRAPRAPRARARRPACPGTAPGWRRPPCDSASDRQGCPRSGCAGDPRHTPGGPSGGTDCTAPPAYARPPR